MKNRVLAEKIISWIKEQAHNVDVLKSVHVHFGFNELNNDDLDAVGSFSYLSSFLLSVALDSGLDLSIYRFLLVAPLKPSVHLDVNLPQRSKITEDLDFEPLSIYMAYRLDGIYYSSIEEYRYPILDSYVYSVDTCVVVYYRVFKDKMSLENKWEYSRCLYFEVLPCNLIAE